MAKPTRLITAAALAFALQTGALAQTPLAPTTPGEDVRRLAPQLVVFAGSEANFQNLVNGLSQGNSVTLTTLTADGFLQTVTFTAANAMSSVEVARTLETARQQLISRGVASPTAQQIGVTLAGGSLPTASGTAQVGGLLTTAAPLGSQPVSSQGPSASTGASVPTPTGGPLNGISNPASNNLVVDIRPTGAALPPGATPGTRVTPGATATATPGTTTGTNASTTPPGTTASTAPQPAVSSSPAVRFTSDSGRISNTSDSLLPSPPTVNSSTGGSNGGPSPAQQLQGRK